MATLAWCLVSALRKQQVSKLGSQRLVFPGPLGTLRGQCLFHKSPRPGLARVVHVAGQAAGLAARPRGPPQNGLCALAHGCPQRSGTRQFL